MTEKTGITGDFHTHTTYSHGKGSVRDNVLAAKNRGLSRIAVTDHGFGHRVYGLSEKKFLRQLNDIELLQGEFSEIEILKGVEANLVSYDGGIDVSEKNLDKLDILIVGFHLTAFWRKSKGNMRLSLRALSSYVKKQSKKAVQKNTDAYVNLVHRHPVDIITHPGYLLKIDCVAVGRACAETGTYVELSSRHKDLTDAEIADFLSTDCQFVLNSDAHTPEAVGDMGYALELIKRLNIPRERIANIDGRTPDFRLKKSRSDGN